MQQAINHLRREIIIERRSDFIHMFFLMYGWVCEVKQKAIMITHMTSD